MYGRIYFTDLPKQLRNKLRKVPQIQSTTGKSTFKPVYMSGKNIQNKTSMAAGRNQSDITGWQPTNRGSIPVISNRFIYFLNCSNRLWGPPSLSPRTYGRVVNLTDHIPTSSAEVTNEWSCTSTPPYAVMTWT